MNTYRVKFYASYRTERGDLAEENLWVEAHNEHHAVAEATMLAMAGTGNRAAQIVGAWLVGGLLHSVTSVIETN